jgi:hypothetical protein
MLHWGPVPGRKPNSHWWFLWSLSVAPAKRTVNSTTTDSIQIASLLSDHSETTLQYTRYDFYRCTRLVVLEAKYLQARVASSRRGREDGRGKGRTRCLMPYHLPTLPLPMLAALQTCVLATAKADRTYLATECMEFHLHMSYTYGNGVTFRHRSELPFTLHCNYKSKLTTYLTSGKFTYFLIVAKMIWKFFWSTSVRKCFAVEPQPPHHQHTIRRNDRKVDVCSEAIQKSHVVWWRRWTADCRQSRASTQTTASEESG